MNRWNHGRPTLSTFEHALWRNLIRERCGIDFGDTRIHYLNRRLWERMQQLDLTSYHAYYQHVENGDADEWNALVELLVNRETAFFRHPPSYEALRRTVLPELLDRRAGQPASDLRLWSAGCSTGQEAYSLAMCALEAIGNRGVAWQARITGSDLSQTARQQATRGRYSARSIASVPALLRRRYLDKRYLDDSRREGERVYDIGSSLRACVRFLPWNLMTFSTCATPPQDVVFCQNLLVYLSAADRGAAIERLACCLEPGGYLFLAPGEMIGFKSPQLEKVELEDCLAYRRLA